jgi:hypothetical protein
MLAAEQEGQRGGGEEGDEEERRMELDGGRKSIRGLAALPPSL